MHTSQVPYTRWFKYDWECLHTNQSRSYLNHLVLAMLMDKTVQIACELYEMFNCTAHLKQVPSALYQESMGVLCIMNARCITALPLCSLTSFICLYIHIPLFLTHLLFISHLFYPVNQMQTGKAVISYLWIFSTNELPMGK